jgi:hypothetical protein
MRALTQHTDRFILSLPTLLLVLILWYAIKHTLSTQRQNPLRRGVYEALYHELATQHSSLWTRRGPRSGVVPVGWWNGFKWRLINSWFSGEKLKISAGYDPATEEFGAWSRVKQGLVRRWLGGLEVMPKARSDLPLGSPSVQAEDRDEGKISRGLSTTERGAVGHLPGVATPVAIPVVMPEIDPTAASRLGSQGRSSARTLSPDGIMVEEKGGSGDERSGDEAVERRSKRTGERLDVPG